jgi:tyrosine ammonia-lyase
MSGTVTMPAIELSGTLDPTLLELVALPLAIRISQTTLERVDACREFMLTSLAEGRKIYGASTGFGPLVDFGGRVDLADQCENTLNHLSTGQGDDLPPAVVRAALLTRLWSLAQGRSGVSTNVLEALAAMLRTDFAPAVPRLGSVGASGDLVPLAHSAQALRGDDSAYAYHHGRRMPAWQALAGAGLEPLVLDGRDALGLVNGTSLTAAAAGLALASIQRSNTVGWILSALMADVLGCATGYLAPHLLTAFAHPGAADVAQHMRELLTGSVPVGNRSLQEPYSIRCVPQLLGATADSIAHAEQVVVTDLNGVSDNPLFFPELGEVVHGGNFFGQPVAFAADLLSLAAIQLGNLAERQLDLMVDPHRNGGLPPMLATNPGQQHGVQGVQLVATSIVANMRRTGTPASVQSLPTNLHNQDVVPFGTQAALSALDQARSLRWLHGSLAVALRQAAHVGRGPTAPECVAVLDQLIEVIPAIEPDRPLRADVLRAADLVDEIASKHLAGSGWST